MQEAVLGGLGFKVSQAKKFTRTKKVVITATGRCIKIGGL
jgi:hypothetical protein